MPEFDVTLKIKTMKIYLVSTKDRVSYDDYDAIVVIAENVDDATIIAKKYCHNFTDNLLVTDVGVAHDDQVRGELLASFNAG